MIKYNFKRTVKDTIREYFAPVGSIVRRLSNVEGLTVLYWLMGLIVATNLATLVLMVSLWVNAV